MTNYDYMFYINDYSNMQQQEISINKPAIIKKLNEMEYILKCIKILQTLNIWDEQQYKKLRAEYYNMKFWIMKNI